MVPLSNIYSPSRLLPHLSSSSTFPPQPSSKIPLNPTQTLPIPDSLILVPISPSIPFNSQGSCMNQFKINFIDLLHCSNFHRIGHRLGHHPFFCPGHLPTSSNFDRADQPVLKIFISTVLHCLPHSRSKSLKIDLVFGSRFFVAGLCLDPGHQRRGARSHILGGAPCATITFALTVAATSRLCTSPTWIGNHKMSH